jgi:hypothetical protein
VKVSVVRRGGFAGIPVSTVVDTDELPDETVQALRAAVADPGSGAVAPGADRFSYELTLGEGVAAQSAVVAEHELPEALSPLLDRLARDGRPGS